MHGADGTVLSPKHCPCRPSPKHRMGPALAGLARARERKAAAAAAAAAAEAGGFGESSGPHGAAGAAVGDRSIAIPTGVADAAAPGSEARPPTPTSGDASPSAPATEALEFQTRLSGASAADGLSGQRDVNGSGAGGSSALDGAEESVDVCLSDAPSQANGGAEGLAASATLVLRQSVGFLLDGSGAAPRELGSEDALAARAAGPPAGLGYAFARAGGAERSDSGGRGSGSATEGHRSNAPDASVPPTSVTDGGSKLHAVM